MYKQFLEQQFVDVVDFWREQMPELSIKLVYDYCAEHNFNAAELIRELELDNLEY